MEYCMEAKALKSSLLSENTMKPNQQNIVNDLWCVTGINNVNSDDFSVDDLLDFSNKDFKENFLEEYEEDIEEKLDALSVSSQDRGVADDDINSLHSFTSHASAGFDPLPAAELAVPVDELENLEWLSQFVDDSASGVSLLCPAGKPVVRTGTFDGVRFEPETKKYTVLGLSYPVRTKARTKRPRPSGKVWSSGLLLLSQSFSMSLSSSPAMSVESFGSTQKPAKKQKKNPVQESGSNPNGNQTVRRCSHCLVQKTPQWRTGPLGPKTLCNACGVRFKSGRLFPEYRPACSPTFSVEVHSNSHRKVLEMRRKKEAVEFAVPGFFPMVQSF